MPVSEIGFINSLRKSFHFSCHEPVLFTTSKDPLGASIIDTNNSGLNSECVMGGSGGLGFNGSGGGNPRDINSMPRAKAPTPSGRHHHSRFDSLVLLCKHREIMGELKFHNFFYSKLTFNCFWIRLRTVPGILGSSKFFSNIGIRVFPM